MTEFKKGGGDDFYDYSLYYPFNGLITVDPKTNPPTTNSIVNPPSAGIKPLFELTFDNGVSSLRSQNIIGEKLKITGGLKFKYNLWSIDLKKGDSLQVGTVNSVSFKFPAGFSTKYTLWRQAYRNGIPETTTTGTIVTRSCEFVSSVSSPMIDYFLRIELTRISPKSSYNEEVVVTAYGINCMNSVSTASVSF